MGGVTSGEGGSLIVVVVALLCGFNDSGSANNREVVVGSADGGDAAF